MLLKLNTGARDSIPYLPFMFLWLTICYAGGFTGHLFSLWQLLQLSPLRQVQDGKSSCLLLIKACLCGFSHCLQDITHHPLSHVSPGTRTCHSDTGQPLRLGSAADLHLWLASSDRHIWRKKEWFPLPRWHLICFVIEREDRPWIWKAVEGPRGHHWPICRVCEKEKQMHMVLWFDNCHWTVL